MFVLGCIIALGAICVGAKLFRESDDKDIRIFYRNNPQFKQTWN